jgi:hypothetical protein
MAAEYLMLKKGKAKLEHCTQKRKNHKATTELCRSSTTFTVILIFKGLVTIFACSMRCHWSYSDMFILKKSVGAVVQDINESIVTHITILKLIHGWFCMSNEILPL